MDELDMYREVKDMIRRMGAQEAWRMLTARAIDEHLAGETEARERTQGLLAALHRLAGGTA